VRRFRTRNTTIGASLRQIYSFESIEMQDFFSLFRSLDSNEVRFACFTLGNYRKMSTTWMSPYILRTIEANTVFQLLQANVISFQVINLLYELTVFASLFEGR